jgi:8-oxo-dGTP diphosphatase
MAITVVAGIIQDSEGLLLCAKRGDWKDAAGKWEFPGGKPLENESLEDALIRELREELAIEVKPLGIFDRSSTIVEGIEIDLVCFSAVLVSPKPTGSSDHSEIRWLKETELSSLDWAAPDFPAVKKLTIPFC